MFLALLLLGEGGLKGALALLGNSAFNSVRSVADTFKDRHDVMFEKFKTCFNSSRKFNYTNDGNVSSRYIFNSTNLVAVQDGSGGGGIGNLILKINAAVSFAITNGMEYLLPPLEPKGHDESELFQDFFDHSPYDVAMRASSVMQLQCPLKFRTLERMAALFPDSSDQNWWEIGGVDEFEQATWGGADNKRCFPQQVVANCGELRPPHSHLGNIGPTAVDAYSTVTAIRIPGSLHYHHNFSISAPFFRQAYAERQALLFRTKWKPLVAEHTALRDSGTCKTLDKDFMVIGVHIRLGDVAEKFDTFERTKRAAAPVHGTWGGKFNSPQMHLRGLELVWKELHPDCTRLLVVTDGDYNSPEIKYFFEHVTELDGWSKLQPAEACLHIQNSHVPPNCKALFFAKDSVSSLDALNLLAYSDIIVASGSQFSRVAALMGGSILLNPNYGFDESTHAIIPPKVSEKALAHGNVGPKLAKQLAKATRRFHHLIASRVHKEHQAQREIELEQEIAKMDHEALQKSMDHVNQSQKLLDQEELLELRAQQLRAENEAIKKKIQQQRRQHIKAQSLIDARKQMEEEAEKSAFGIANP